MTVHSTARDGGVEVVPVRWEALFADLESGFDEAEAAELAAEVRDRGRAEAARLRLVDRLRAGVGSAVTLRVAGAGPVQGVLVQVCPEWLLVVDGPSEVLVPFAALLTATAVGPDAVSPAAVSPVEERLTFGYALRALARRRVTVSLVQVDGGSMHGTVDRVGSDFLEISEHPAGEARRPDAVTALRMVPFAAVGALRSV